MTSSATVRRGKDTKASVYLAMRTQLLSALNDVDGEIDQVLKARNSQRAADRARVLFLVRARLVDELHDYGLDIDPHPAVENL